MTSLFDITGLITGTFNCNDRVFIPTDAWPYGFYAELNNNSLSI